MYPEVFVRPMRAELTSIGFREMRTPEEVDATLKQEKGTVLVVVNSICGCAAGKARPAVAQALTHPARPEILTTVFAGQDPEATNQARSYFTGYPPSSPSIALLRDGKLVFMLQRSDIEGRESQAIAADLTQAFDRFCAPARAASGQ
jgi:putative YphP/YqiW family bacilliredoxin